LSTEQRRAFKDITSLWTIFVRRAHLPNTKYRIPWGGRQCC